MLAIKVQYPGVAESIDADVDNVAALLRVSAEHVVWLTANRDLGIFLLDPVNPSERTIRVVARG